MKRELESAFTRRLKRDLSKIGGIFIVIHGGIYQSGYPDRVLVHSKWRGLIELKKDGGTLRDQQQATIEALWRAAPGCAYVVWPEQIAHPSHDGIAYDSAKGGWMFHAWDGSVTTLIDILSSIDKELM